MKMKLFFRISVLALCISMSLSSFADDKKDGISVEDINWSDNNQSLGSIVSTSNEPKITYLYATTPKMFVTVGGRYGAQPILAEVGMNFYVEKVADDTNGRYYIHSWVNNPTTSQGTGNADYLGVKPAMDDDERIFSITGDQTKKSIYLFVDRDHIPAGVKIDRLPDDASETLRLVRIGDYDVCPCIGKHVRSTAQIGKFVLLGTNWDEHAHSLRIRFKIVQ